MKSVAMSSLLKRNACKTSPRCLPLAGVASSPSRPLLSCGDASVRLQQRQHLAAAAADLELRQVVCPRRPDVQDGDRNLPLLGRQQEAVSRIHLGGTPSVNANTTHPANPKPRGER